MDCIHGDDELLCRFTCPVRCICKGYAMNCKVYDLNKTSISTFSKFSRSLTFIRDNEAEITLAEDVLDFPYLYLLNLSRCNIENIEPNAFFNVANLRVLDLSNNRIITLFPLIFSGLQHLHTLILDGNSYLETLEAFTFQNLKSVKHLRIAGTKLKILVTNTFAGLNLQRLELENNNFQHIEKSGLGNLEVKYISFEFNSVTSFDKGMFTGVSSLNYLRTPAYKYCCIRPNYVAEDRCFPTKDEFSSCEDLMRNSVLQTLLWIIGLCSLLGNILSFLYRLKFDRERLKLGYGIFVTNLAVADFCMGMYLITIAVADAVFRKRYIFMDDYWRNSIWCTLAGVLSTLSSEASVMFLCLITLDRLLVIKYPFGQVRLNGKRAAVLSAVVWVLCSVIALFPLMYSAYFRSTFYNKSGVCIALPLTRDRPPGWLYSVLIFVVLNFVTFLLITAGQWSIFTNVRKSRKGLTKGSLARKRDLTVARNLLLVVATDFLCWFPIGCIGLMALSGHVISGDVYAWAAVFILPVNSALNPVLYTLTAILGKKNFTPRINEQANQAVRPDLGKYIIMRRYHVHDSGPENAYKSLGEILHDTSLPASIILKIAHQLTQTLQVLHKSSLMMGTVNENSLYIKVTENKIKGDVQLRQEPNLCKRRTDTCIDMHELGLLLRTLIRNSYCKTNKSG
ncbi:G-protein coupled receptor GRL101-like [Mercenaria mercenaria]|uniref:G-protein coupled receptor GRL101-like n=1 Tax=Mercenaria mercenaria TaxID=6596 RepID=UPI00234F3A1E|nr:G-protein coupled receptor GRL101-like [Mercenaria mercenaria]